MGKVLSRLFHPKIGTTKPVHLSKASIVDQPLEHFDTDAFGNATWKTLLSGTKTPTSELTAGIATCAKGGGRLAHHRHAQAEIYLILSGEGIADVADQQYRVSKGDVLYIPGNAEHGIRNAGSDEDLEWFYCFAADSFEEIKYRFSQPKGNAV